VKKTKVDTVHAVKAYVGSEVTAPFVFNASTQWIWIGKITRPAALLSGKEPLCPLNRGLDAGLDDYGEDKISCPRTYTSSSLSLSVCVLELESRTRPSGSYWLYRLKEPGYFIKIMYALFRTTFSWGWKYFTEM